VYAADAGGTSGTGAKAAARPSAQFKKKACATFVFPATLLNKGSFEYKFPMGINEKFTQSARACWSFWC
jgi:hypothetical protein